MKLFNKSLLIGLGLGIAVTLVLLDVLAGRAQDQMHVASMPVVLRPFSEQKLAQTPENSNRLPKPWLPESSKNLDGEWKFQSMDGKTVRFASFNGKVVFLNFWATYCAPCVNELPGIKRLASSMKNENVAFLMVSLEKPEHVQKFLAKNPIELPIYVAGANLPADLLVQGIPVTFIVDRRGKLVYRSVGAMNWDDDVARSYLRSLEAQ